ncbi:hypothetical protein HDE77_002940 [Rhodanobacter sp. MP7CTX1]|jgi:hypothetical protein|nr:hypothetical protein [Rhodanobacter sp. MP7CTX1]
MNIVHVRQEALAMIRSKGLRISIVNALANGECKRTCWH